MLKVAVAHEWLVDYSGSERVLEQLMNMFPNTDLFRGGRLPSCVYDNGVRPKAHLPDKTDNGHAPASCLYKDLHKVVPVFGLTIGGL